MKLHFFKDEEFRGQIDMIDPRLLVLLDTLRLITGIPIAVSQHPEAIGRTTGTSWHNYKLHGAIYAIDVMPIGQWDPGDIIQIATMIGFTGIGYYPDWNPRPGLHLDTRTNEEPEYPALWGGIKVDGVQVYTSIERALNRNDHMGI